MGVAWIDGQLHITVAEASNYRRWCSTSLVKTVEEFRLKLATARTELGIASCQAYLVLSHPQLTLHRTEIPPAEGPVSIRLRSREVDRQKPFAGLAVWSEDRKGSSNTIQWIHLLPRDLRDELRNIFQSTGWPLVSIQPLAQAIRERFHPMDPETLVGVRIPRGLWLWVPAPQPPDLFRWIPCTSLDQDRLEAEVQRTVAFARQQLDLSVTRFRWVVPTEEKPRLAEWKLHSPLDCRVEAHVLMEVWADWASQSRGAVDLLQDSSEDGRPNTIKPPWVLSFSRGGGMLCCVLAAAMEWMALQDRSLRSELDRHHTDVSRIESHETSKWNEVWGKEVGSIDCVRWIQILTENLPTGLTLTHLDLKMEPSGFRAILSGCAEPPGNPVDPGLVLQFCRRLTERGVATSTVATAPSPRAPGSAQNGSVGLQTAQFQLEVQLP